MNTVDKILTPYQVNCFNLTQQLIERLDPVMVEALHTSIDCGAALEMTQEKMKEFFPERFDSEQTTTNLVSLHEWRIRKGK